MKLCAPSQQKQKVRKWFFLCQAEQSREKGRGGGGGELVHVMTGQKYHFVTLKLLADCTVCEGFSLITLNVLHEFSHML